MKSAKLFLLECEKNRHRKNFLLVLVLLFIQTLFIANSLRNYEFKANGWLLQFYNMPLLNAIFLPTITAVLASRHMELEHRGSMWKALYTMVKPLRLFFIKLLYGMLTLFMLCVVQTSLLLLNGNMLSFSGNADYKQFLLYFLSTFLISFILYFLQSLLSFVFCNQVIPVSVGLIGSLAGLFLMFLEDGILHRIIPWGLYGATMFTRMDWNPETRAIRYYTVAISPSAFLSIALWIIGLSIISVFLLKRKDIDELSIPLITKFQTVFLGQDRHSNAIQNTQCPKTPVSFSILCPELLKIKTSYVWLPLLILPSISAIIGTLNYLGNVTILKNGWYDLWSQHTLFLCYFFLPAMVGVVNSYLWHLEHQGTNWNQLMVSIKPRRIILDKFLVSWLISSIGILWIVLLYFLCGFIAEIPMNLTVATLLDWILSGILGMGSVCAIQLLFSLIIRNFAAPIGIAIAGGIAGLFVTAQGTPLILPYSLLSLGMHANNPSMKLNHVSFILACLFFIFFLLSFCILYLKKSDVKTV